MINTERNALLNILHLIRVLIYCYRSKNPTILEVGMVGSLRDMIDEHNMIAKNFRMAAERFKENDDQDVKLCLMGRRSRDGRMYN